MPRLRAFLLVLAGFGFLASSRADAQDRAIPSASYFTHFAELYDGDANNALEEFNDDLKSGIKTVNARWIDSICYHTMCGESLYQMGKYRAAVEHYNAALNWYLAYPDWMLRVQFPPVLQPNVVNRPAAPWGTSRRNAKLIKFPEHMTVSVGKLDNSDVVQKGGVVQQAMMYPVTVQEIWRCVAVSLHRRREILGPICAYDPLTKKAVVALQSAVAPPNHWSQAWVDVCLGIAYASDGQNDRAGKTLEGSLLVSGQYDHPLTSWALLEMGKLSLEKGDLNNATLFLEEASYSGFDNGDFTVVEEAFRHGFTLHLLANKQGLFPPLLKAIGWAKTKGGKNLYASLLSLAAENYVVMGQTMSASNAVEEMVRALSKRSMKKDRGDFFEMDARQRYVASLIFYQKGNLKSGDEALATALDYKRLAGRWIYQINLADELAVDGTVVTKRMSLNLYDKLLRDPQPEDWNNDPLEALSVLVATNMAPYEHWYENTRETNAQPEVALEVADRIRRRRFYSTLHSGGRLLSLRWILEAPEAALDPKTILQRQDLLVKFPRYAELAQSAKQAKADLAKLSLVPDSQDAAKQQSALLDQWAKTSAQQEAKLHEIAVRREPAGLVFPPLRKTRDVQNALPNGTVMLIFFTTSRSTQAYLLSNQKYTAWDLVNPQAIEAKLTGLLRDMGNYDGNHELSLKDVASESWKKSAKELMDLLVAGTKVNLGDNFDELIIVPDGLMWYVPFEALQVTSGGKQESLLSHCRIRYAPTMGLGVPNPIPRKSQANTAVVAGKLYPRDDAAVGLQAFEQLRKAVPDAVALKSPLPAVSSIYRAQFDGLIVNDDILSPGGPYDWSPVQMDKSKPAGALVNWMSLPWGAPDYVLLPGYHTRAEAQMKGASNGYPGSEIFLSVCGLMSTGTRTILLSRWRTGGVSSYDLVREFAKELPHTTADDAWQRSVQLVSSAPIVPDQEPRIQKGGTSEPPKAEHPFFWSGYMLVDPGVPPEKVNAPPPGPPTIKPLKPGGK